jgi:hypothetical protein
MIWSDALHGAQQIPAPSAPEPAPGPDIPPPRDPTPPAPGQDIPAPDPAPLPLRNPGDPDVYDPRDPRTPPTRGAGKARLRARNQTGAREFARRKEGFPLLK